MKIYFDNVNFNSRSGPNSFASRLAKALAERDHVLADKDDFDVALSFIEPSQFVLQSNKPFVQRLDGIWFKPEQFHTHNISIRNGYSKANAVVFQSKFDENFVTKWWNKPNNSRVINNGISKAEIDLAINLSSRKFSDLSAIRAQYDKLFVCSSNWHPQKRLQTNVDLFAHVIKNFHIKACLLILGDTPQVNVPKHLIPHVFYTGNIPHNSCIQIYSQCDYMFHCAWLDHCPNVVAECLMSGTPVVCSSEGGTKELVEDSGVVLKDRKEWDMQPVDYDKPPTLDINQINESFLTKTVSFETLEKLNLDNVVQSYEEILISVL
jgi:glycosyltransferase involved in cell wall biosynthesis